MAAHRHVEARMRRHAQGEVSIFDVTGAMAQINIQGPNSRALLQSITDHDLSNEVRDALLAHAAPGVVTQLCAGFQVQKCQIHRHWLLQASLCAYNICWGIRVRALRASGASWPFVPCASSGWC